MAVKKLSVDELKNLGDKIVIDKTDMIELKKSGSANCEYGKFNEFLGYNEMLNNLAYGSHTKTTVSYLNNDWTFRILTSKEENDIEYKLDKKFGDDLDNKVANNAFRYDLERMCMTLHLALTPHPYHTQNNPNENKIYELNDIWIMPKDIVLNLYRMYRVFVEKSVQDPMEFSVEEIEQYVEICKKKPQASLDMNFWTLQQIISYLMNYKEVLEQKISSAIDS